MKIKRSLILSLEQVLTGMLQTPMNPELSYQVAFNAVAVSECAETIKKSYQPVDGFDKYEAERRALLEKVAGKSPNGQYQLTPDQATTFNKELKGIDLKHKAVLNLQKIYSDEFNAMLEKETDVNAVEINLKDMKVDIEPAKMVILIQSGIVKNGSE